MSTVPASRPVEFSRLVRPSLGVGVVFLAPCIVAAFFSPTQFFRAYLAAYIFYLGLGLGCMAILMVYHLTGGAWGFLTCRILEAGTKTLPLLAGLFVPLACGVGYLYLWAQPAVVAADRKIQLQQIYLNVPFFWFRAALFFLLWLGVAYLLHSWSVAEDRAADPDRRIKLQRLSGIGLVIYGITIHFASVDWVMSLQPAFHSSIFGPVFAAGQLVSAQALVVALVAWRVLRPPLDEFASGQVLNDLGNLLLTFLIIWAYTVWFQFMLIWIANLPVDVIWYVPRSRGGWQWVAYALFVLHFAVPFFLLLLRVVKRTPRLAAGTAGLVCFMQLVFDYYQVVPSFPGTTLADHWMDFLTPLGIGGIWFAYFFWELGRRPLLPLHDPYQRQAIHLRHIDEEELAREEALSHG